MDEAERCHRIAILDSGRLVADGTPRELTSALAGRTLEVHAAQPRRAQQALVGLPGVLSVAQIGNSLRVLVAGNGDANARVADALRTANLEAEVAPAEPNLEDVFVGHARARPAARGRMKLQRLLAVMPKELRQMRRDRITLAMIVGIPVMQLVLFGYAINLNLRGLGRHRRPGEHRRLARAGDGHGRDRRDRTHARGEHAATTDGCAAPRRDQRRRGGAAGFERRRIDGREAVQVLVDGSDTVVQGAALQLAQMPLDDSRALANATGAREPRRGRSPWSASTTPSGARR